MRVERQVGVEVKGVAVLKLHTADTLRPPPAEGVLRKCRGREVFNNITRADNPLVFRRDAAGRVECDAVLLVLRPMRVDGRVAWPIIEGLRRDDAPADRIVKPPVKEEARLRRAR